MATCKYNLCDIGSGRPISREEVGAIFISRQRVEAVEHLGAEIGVRDDKVIAEPAIRFWLGDAHRAYSIEYSNREDAFDRDIVSGRECRDRLSQLNENIREVRFSGKPWLPGAILVPTGYTAQVRGVLVLGMVV